MAVVILWYNSLPNRITLINHVISFKVVVMDEQYWNLLKLTESSENDFLGPEKKTGVGYKILRSVGQPETGLFFSAPIHSMER